MEPHQTAEIIPFPVRPFPICMEDPAERLRRALAALDAALERQRSAVADWRFSLAALHHGVDSLGTSLADYHASLAALGRSMRSGAE